MWQTAERPTAPLGFQPLSTPEEHEELLAATAATNDAITVVKFEADYCRTCRAAAPKLRYQVNRFAERNPQARFFSMQLQKKTSLAKREEMLAYFKQRNATQLPYVEIFVGDELVDTFVVTPSRIEFFKASLTGAREALRERRRRRERRRLLVALRDGRRELRRTREKAEGWWRLASVVGTATPDGFASRQAFFRSARRRYYLQQLRKLRREMHALEADDERQARRLRLFNRMVRGRK